MKHPPIQAKTDLTRSEFILASGLLILLIWGLLAPQAARADGGGWPTATPTLTQAVIILSPATSTPQPDTNALQPDIIFEIAPEPIEPTSVFPALPAANPPAGTQKSGNSLSLVLIFGALVLAAAAASVLVLRMRRR